MTDDGKCSGGNSHGGGGAADRPTDRQTHTDRPDTDESLSDRGSQAAAIVQTPVPSPPIELHDLHAGASLRPRAPAGREPGINRPPRTPHPPPLHPVIDLHHGVDRGCVGWGRGPWPE